MFKVDDRVQLKNQARFGGVWTGPMTISKVAPTLSYSIYVKHPLRGRGAFDPHELELVEPEVPLFRKGDKITVTYEVLQDEPERRPGADRHVRVTAPGVRAADGVTRIAEFLAAGTIERAPEPPYVPKPGDKFNFGIISDPAVLNTCIWSDDKGLLYESRVDYRNYVPHGRYPYFKRS